MREQDQGKFSILPTYQCIRVLKILGFLMNARFPKLITTVNDASETSLCSGRKSYKSQRLYGQQYAGLMSDYVLSEGVEATVKYRKLD